MKRPIIKVDFGKPIEGYWDGGNKRFGDFLPEQKFKPKTNMKWGCWELNFWFTARSGVSWKTAARAAEKRLRSIITRPNTKISIMWEDDGK